MPIRHSWLSEDHRVIVLHFEGEWTWEEFGHTYTQSVVPLLSAEPHTVHLVSDMSRIKGLPVGSALAQARNVVRHLAPNQGMIVTVTNDTLIHSLAGIFNQIYGKLTTKPVPVVKTMAEALAAIEAYDKAHPTPIAG